MVLDPWIERIITFAVGGGMFKLGDYLISKKKADSEDFALLKDTWREEFRRYEEKFDKLNSKYGKLEEKLERSISENEDLRQTINSLKESYPDLPVPIWLKDHNGMMLSLNREYEDAFLLPQGKTRSDYIGHYDEDIWGEEIANIFRANDTVAISKKHVSFVFETNIGHALLKKWEFFKYPKYVDGIFIGVGGLALPKSNNPKFIADRNR